MVTSLPYNKLGLRHGHQYIGQIVYDTYEDNMNEDEYQQWQDPIQSSAERLPWNPDDSSTCHRRNQY